jgi:hypothetical protein
LATGYSRRWGRRSRPARRVPRADARERSVVVIDPRGVTAGLRLGALCESIGLRPGERVLDVAGGNGNAAFAAARRWAEVTATDFVAHLLDHAQQCAALEGFPLTVCFADVHLLAVYRKHNRSGDEEVVPPPVGFDGDGPPPQACRLVGVQVCPSKDIRTGRRPAPMSKKLPVITLAEREEAARLAGMNGEVRLALADVAATVREGLLAMRCAAGLAVMHEIMQAELTRRVGPKTLIAPSRYVEVIAVKR